MLHWKKGVILDTEESILEACELWREFMVNELGKHISKLEQEHITALESNDGKSEMHIGEQIYSYKVVYDMLVHDENAIKKLCAKHYQI